jgi:outer membrane protein OmpU
MDGLEIGFGVGEKGTGTAGDNGQTDDMDTMYATYVYGPVTFGYQVSNIDTYSTTADDEQTRWGILYAVNDELSISYQDHVNDDSTTAVDEEATGISMSYTVGSMTFKAHRNKGENLGNAVTNASEHTELGVTFAF